jgi:hypothetical protein
LQSPSREAAATYIGDTADPLAAASDHTADHVHGHVVELVGEENAPPAFRKMAEEGESVSSHREVRNLNEVVRLANKERWDLRQYGYPTTVTESDPKSYQDYSSLPAPSIARSEGNGPSETCLPMQRALRFRNVGTHAQRGGERVFMQACANAF